MTTEHHDAAPNAGPGARARRAGPRHGLLTRIVHGGLAAAVIAQLLTSLVFAEPKTGRPGDIWFEIHEYVGLAAFGFAALFWLVVAVRRRGTPRALLFPWLSAARRRDLRDDLLAHLRALRRAKLPPYRENAPLAAAVHGLGLLAVTAMAATGMVWWLSGGGPDAGLLVEAAMALHEALANLVWAYLIGHAGLAALHHYADHARLGEMWSLRPQT